MKKHHEARAIRTHRYRDLPRENDVTRRNEQSVEAFKVGKVVVLSSVLVVDRHDQAMSGMRLARSLPATWPGMRSDVWSDSSAECRAKFFREGGTARCHAATTRNRISASANVSMSLRFGMPVPSAASSASTTLRPSSNAQLPAVLQAGVVLQSTFPQ